jgi:type IV pilus assembly protein PilC
MKLYYRAVTQDGKSIRGIIDAKDQKEIADYLRKHQLIPVKIVPASQTGIRNLASIFGRVSSSDIVFFTRQLSSMLASGLTLIQALNILKSQVQNERMMEVINTVITQVQDGKTFSSAIEQFPKIFSPIYIALIRTAESSGLLDKIFLGLADNLEKQEKLKKTIQGALLYPIIVVVMMIMVVIILMVVVIPQLKSLYGGSDISFPLPTQVIVSSANFFVSFWYILVTLALAGGFYFRNWYTKPSGRKTIDKYILKVPVLGKLLLQSMMSQFTRTLGLLVSSGSLVVDSLLKSSEVVDNVIVKDAIVLVAKRVEKGISMGEAMEVSYLFPPMIVEMVKIGEQTGKVDDSLLRTADYYEREVEESVKVLTTLLEPIIMVMLAVGVGFLIIAVITPLYNLITSIQ